MRKDHPWWMSPVCLVLGAAIGTLAFLSSAAFFAGNPLSNTLMSVHGVLVRDQLTKLDDLEKSVVSKLLTNGGLIDANTFLSSLTAFYSTIIQVLVASFFVFGVISFFIIKQHSLSQVETQIDESSKKQFLVYIKSIEFNDLVRKEISLTAELETEALQEQLENVGGLIYRVEQIEERIASQSSAEEQNGDPEEIR